ncbi:hypothetical protein C1I98_27425 [Spongiactinospora gelatinilytica]|uniref:YcaO domain-containing protein n=1 Tax=Spongiactinospora gelatinilytica TaxID=2666298 RepID=A0A2W2FIM8_9ACTN|nr:YcaO-like family protein [Spongiactinospora gelatinilytica]PZG35433.1 hypothetical protein C1I98_27425 [Spongiactinospora gelatinilytica]
MPTARRDLDSEARRTAWEDAVLTGAHERAVPPAEAARRVAAASAALGLRAELVDVGEGRDPTAWWCGLLAGTAEAGPVASGMGKGHPEQARVGAGFEAVEHYLTGPAAFDPAALTPVAPARVAAGPLRAESCAPLLARMPGSRMACLRYRAFGGGAALPVPLFLSAPWYTETGAAGLRDLAGDDCDYTHLMRYACNSGSAAGADAAEALLHALNEAIERDALSLLLVRAFLCRAGPALRLIDPATLPYGLARAHATAEDLTGSPVYLLDITSDVAVPTTLAYTAPAARRPHRRGSGTSLSPGHAAWRALTELVQTTLGETWSRPAVPPRADLAGLAAYPALRACGRFDLTGPLRAARPVPFPQAAGPPPPIRAQIRAVVATLAAQGRPAYRRTVRALPCGVTAVHVIVPGLERFMLVTDGNLVVPGPRGRAVVSVAEDPGRFLNARRVSRPIPSR